MRRFRYGSFPRFSYFAGLKLGSVHLKSSPSTPSTMKSSYVLLATLGLAAAQQKFTDVIPECSVKCLTQAVKDGTKCSSIDDSQCICEATNYRNIYTVGVSCVLAACGGDVATGTLVPRPASWDTPSSLHLR